MTQWSVTSATDMARQFNTVGPISQNNDVGFVLTVDEAHPIILSDVAQPFILLQEVMVTP